MPLISRGVIGRWQIALDVKASEPQVIDGPKSKSHFGFCCWVLEVLVS